MRSTRYSEVSDEVLFRHLREGKEGAYYALFERYWERLYTVSKGLLRDEHLSKDMVQDVFLSLWERRHEIDNKNIRAYLDRAIRFRVYKQLRDGKLSHEHEAFLARLPAPAAGSETEFRELENEIHHHIRELPERCREVFVLSRFEHLSNREIALRLKLSQRTIETHISNALKHLRTRLDANLAPLLVLWAFYL